MMKSVESNYGIPVVLVEDMEEFVEYIFI